MIPIMPDEEFQKLSVEEQNAQWDAELDSMTEEDMRRFHARLTERYGADAGVDADTFFESE
jgi:hypothetical protein